ncbi:hypothetical protein HPB50_016180 [Hyalomma asiaticum]|uniref:Uncharacterized protein n=1 Tax=Hyalomma asiaticum TaxID=266040 RepID=A0ACB7TLB2_HYAAI|nr:hypothetical protein HPB50_016180 [Hyalomma asiaticum]
MSATNLSRPPSQVSVTGSGSSSSRIEVSTVQVNQEEQGGNLTIYGDTPTSIRTTISSEGTNYQIADRTGQVKNVNVPNTRPPFAGQGKYEKRVIIENGIETVEEYHNDRLVSRTVNGEQHHISNYRGHNNNNSITLPSTRPQQAHKCKYEKRIIIENIAETVEETSSVLMITRGSSISIDDGGRAGASSSCVLRFRLQRSGFSRRAGAMSAFAIKGGGDAFEVLCGLKADGSDSPSVDSFGPLTPTLVKRQVREDYGRRAMELVSRYLRVISDFSAHASKVDFLNHCRIIGVVPVEYRVHCPDIYSTRRVLRLLGICSFKLMLADLDYHGMRKVQLLRLLERLRESLASLLSSKDLQKVLALSKAKYESTVEDTRLKQRVKLEELLEEYEINGRGEDDE